MPITISKLDVIHMIEGADKSQYSYNKRYSCELGSSYLARYVTG